MKNTLRLLLFVLLTGAVSAQESVKIVTLGDSITKGVRPGVKANETFAAYLQDMLKAKGVTAEVINVGVGGEDTGGALKRLDKDVGAKKPRIVAIMYGTNDSYVDKGKQTTRLTSDQFLKNSTELVRKLRKDGIEVILMTEPSWAKQAGPDGAGNSPNVPLKEFMAITAQVAAKEKVPLIDHFAHWTKAEQGGVNLNDWTTDGYHPNPRGHREIATLMLPVVQEVLKKKAEPKPEPDLTTTFAASDPDFKIQGEYEGEVPGKGKLGAQVVAKGSGKFEVYLLGGGLPGAGWDKKTRSKLAAVTGGNGVTFGDNASGTIADGVLKGKTESGDAFTLKRVERKSPTLGEKPPEGATVLFGGKSAEHWNNGRIVAGELLYRGTTSKIPFGGGKLHLEFRTSYEPKKGGQGRGNSGVYILDREIQVLDSFGLEGKDNECGGFYSNRKPDVNMCLPPLTWQTYDVEIKPDDKGDLRATVWHNGVKIHEDYAIAKKGAKPKGILLQDHGNAVVYRNIWFVSGAK